MSNQLPTHATPSPPHSSPEASNFDDAPARARESRVDAASSIARPSSLAWLAFASVCLFWGTSSPLIRYTVRYVDPLTLVTLRFFVAGGLLWGVLWSMGRRPPLRGLSRIFVSGVTLAVTNLLVTFGFQRVEAGTGTLLMTTTAVAFAVVDVAWPGGTKQLSRTAWVGLLFGMVGVAVLSISPESVGTGQWQGYLMLALSSWIWPLGSVAQARFPSGQDPLQSSSWQMLIASVVVCPIALLNGGLHVSAIPPEGWVAIIALVTTASLLGFVSFVYVLQRLPAYVAGSYPFVNAIVAAAVGVFWLAERLTPRFYVAAVLVLGGVALIQRRDASRPSHTPAHGRVSRDIS